MSEIKKVESEDLKIIKVDHVKNLLNAGPTLEKIIKDNPFIEPSEETINAAETARKALKNGRTTIDRHEKDIASGLSKARKAIKSKADELRLIVEDAEQKQTEANNIYFDNKAWKDALETNTKQSYLDYLENFGFYGVDAGVKLAEIDAAEEQAKAVFQNWKTNLNNKIVLIDNLDDLDKISQEVDIEDLEKFIDPAAAFDARENFYNLLDAKKVSLEKSEAERIEREKLEKEREALNLRNDKRNEELRPYIVFIRDYNALLQSEENEYQKQFADIKKGAEFERECKLKEKKEREEQSKKDREETARLKAEAEKKAEEDKILKQLENYNNAVETFELIAMSIPGINEVEQLNIYSGKIEGIIEKDFGDNETDIKERYETFNIILTNRRDTLNAELQKQKAIDAQKLQDEQNEVEEQPKIVTYEPAPTSPNYEKIKEHNKIVQKGYNEKRVEALESVIVLLNVNEVMSDNQKLISEYDLEKDIIQYISDLLI